ncbi:MAG: rRNA pseudouridine synthase [Chitinophagaceae bacterium]|nr:rRNA pseudouridine synthase [Chitinophagaceae bacterium]
MSKGSNFQKFIGKPEKGSKLKERIRQEKKKVRQETKEYFAEQKAKAKAARENTPKKDIPGKKLIEIKKGDKVSYLPPAGVSERAGTDNKSKTAATTRVDSEDLMPLNKYVAHAGICSRRDAADLVKSGKVAVNGRVITEPGFKVHRKDEIKVSGKKVVAGRNYVYILVNKPKDHITTTDDPEGRKTVMDLVKNATTERVFPIGRLDRNTTGVLLLTNDGELTQKLSHPSYEVKKIYEVTLDRPLAKKDFDELVNGITLEDGFISPDSLAYADSRNKAVIGIEIHSGKNRIVRRIFEKLGYDVRNLDRVMYANLTKKNVERGKWRFLQEKEIRLLKFMNASYAKKK